MEDYQEINKDLQNRINYYEDIKRVRKNELENEIIDTLEYYDNKIAEIKRGIESNNKYCCPVFIIKGSYNI